LQGPTPDLGEGVEVVGLAEPVALRQGEPEVAQGGAVSGAMGVLEVLAHDRAAVLVAGVGLVFLDLRVAGGPPSRTA